MRHHRIPPVLCLALVVCAAWNFAPALASNRLVRFQELMAGANGDSRIQFIELVMDAAGQNCWGPQVPFPATPGSDETDDDCLGGERETRSRAMLLFFDAQDREIGRYKFPENPPSGAARAVLVATADFAALPGAPVPDFVMPPLMSAVSGKVCFRSNAENPQAEAINICVSYGAFTGNTEGAGTPAAALPTTDVLSLQRQAGTSDNLNAQFTLRASPSPLNAAGQTGAIALASRVAQGSTLFNHETFLGNGRTCATCHVPRLNGGLTPADVQARFATVSSTFDPLFIAESAATGFDFNLNTLTVAARPVHQSGSDFLNTSGGDLRGIITGAGGARGRVLARVGATVYRIYGGLSPAFSGTITDAAGNQAAVVSVMGGDLNVLDSPARMRTSRSPLFPQGRALILENVDGFTNPPVFRKSPHLLNLALTAPFGFNGDVADLQTFSISAGIQHFPRTLARSAASAPGANPDFRAPTPPELAALEAFMQSLQFPAGTDTSRFDLTRFVRFAEQQRGRDLFFGNARCSRCHVGPVLASSTRFNTGVVNQPINSAGVDNLPCEPSVGACGSREFSVPQLFDIRNLGPYFHDASAPTLRDAVAFYDTPAFNNSPGARFSGGINLGPQQINDITAFLAGLSNLSLSAIGNRTVAQNASTGPIPFGVNDIDTPAAQITFTALSSDVTRVPLENIVFGGTGVNRTVTVTTATGSPGPATITIVASDGTNTAEEPFVINVIGNSPPTISTIAAQTINEDQATPDLPFNVNDAETPAASLTLSASSSNTTLVPVSRVTFGGSGGTRTVRVAPAANQFGSATITVAVTDAVGGIARTTFTLTVTSVNDPPTLTSVADQTIEQGRSMAVQPFTVDDVETPANSLRVTAASSNTVLVPAAGIALGGTTATRTIAVTPDPAHAGTATITITVTDADGASATSQFAVFVGAIPTGLTASADGSLVLLAWQAPPAAGMTGYRVEAGAAPGATAITVSTGSTQTSFALSVPTPGTWFVRVRGVLESSVTAASNEVSVTTSAVPSRPTNLTVAMAAGTATFTWSPPASGSVTGYQVEAGSSAGGSNIAVAPLAATTPSLVLRTVPTGTFFVRVRARNAAGLSAPSNEVSFTYPAPSAAPGPPVALVGTAAGNTVTLTWQQPTSGGPPDTYIVEAGRSAGASDLANAPIGSRLSLTQSGLASGTYFVRLRARNEHGTSAPSNEVVIVVGTPPVVPGAPQNLAAVVSGSTVTLTWQPPVAGGPPAGYVLEAGTRSGASDLGGAAVGPSTSFTTSGVPPGAYFIRVRAVNASGGSTPSNEVIVTVQR